MIVSQKTRSSFNHKRISLLHKGCIILSRKDNCKSREFLGQELNVTNNVESNWGDGSVWSDV